MFKVMMQHKKLKDIINIRESETWLSILFSAILCVVLYSIDLYEKFDLFSDTLLDIIICFLGGYMGIIGFSLSGMAIMLGLFNKKQICMIEKYNEPGIIEKIMSSYAFLAFISAINIFILIIVSFAISSDKKKFPICLFAICTFVILYLTFFNIFYAVSLVFNCVSLFSISKIYTACEERDDVTSTANDIKADYMLGLLVKSLGISRKDLLEGLENEASSLPAEMQKKVMEYFEKHYPEQRSEK